MPAENISPGLSRFSDHSFITRVAATIGEANVMRPPRNCAAGPPLFRVGWAFLDVSGPSDEERLHGCVVDAPRASRAWKCARSTAVVRRGCLCFAAEEPAGGSTAADGGT